MHVGGGSIGGHAALIESLFSDRFYPASLPPRTSRAGPCASIDAHSLIDSLRSTLPAYLTSRRASGQVVRAHIPGALDGIFP
jgi:hypothetical protein